MIGQNWLPKKFAANKYEAFLLFVCSREQSRQVENRLNDLLPLRRNSARKTVYGIIMVDFLLPYKKELNGIIHVQPSTFR